MTLDVSVDGVDAKEREVREQAQECGEVGRCGSSPPPGNIYLERSTWRAIGAQNKLLERGKGAEGREAQT
ncbi:hypothetical protein BDV98DRAFT_303050 [Pterulicium gracile]|uniref:Uncharacterized protein n=1 Tax=Pterulicium gracile TaxID=1884261 RepID=A0A5C3Q3R3_9AGAR|nr:hypothetical protein BDV98DRAFT_303050 [Pterula gracilis]